MKNKKKNWKDYLFKMDFVNEEGNVDYYKIKDFVKDAIKERDYVWVDKILNAMDYCQGSACKFDPIESVCSYKDLIENLGIKLITSK